MPCIPVLRAHVELHEALVEAARIQRDEAGDRPASPANRSLYEGCCAAYEARKREAEEARGVLIRAIREKIADVDAWRKS